MGSPRHKVIVWFAVLLSAASLVGVNHRARTGRAALLKWEDTFLTLEQGEPIYGRGLAFGELATSEGYPTLPLSLLLLSPFRSLGPQWGTLAWAFFKVILAWWIVTRALDFSAGATGRPPPWAVWVVLLLSVRVLHSDLQHGNLNLVVGATVLAAFSAWARGRDTLCGFWLGVGAILKVTPLLGVVFLLRKKSRRGLLGLAGGLATCALVLPALWLGWETTLELNNAWWDQMIGPYLEGTPLTIVQTEQINQSMLGVGARWLTDCVAIVGRAGSHTEDVSINVLSLSPAAFHWVHRIAAAWVLCALWLSLSPDDSKRPGYVILGEAALLALAMLILSERSWKQHYVLLPLPLAFLTGQIIAAHGSASVRFSARALAGLCLFAVTGLIALSGDAVLGDFGADLAEAYGVWFWAGALLFASIGILLRPYRPES